MLYLLKCLNFLYFTNVNGCKYNPVRAIIIVYRASDILIWYGNHVPSWQGSLLLTWFYFNPNMDK